MEKLKDNETSAKVLKEVSKMISSGKTYESAVEEIFLKSYDGNYRKRYFEIKTILSNFKKKLIDEAQYESVVKKTEKIISGALFITPDFNAENLYKDIQIAMERKELILNTVNQILNKELIVDNYLKNYILSNFHRTLSEIALKIFSEPLFIIVDYFIQGISKWAISNEEKEEKLKLFNKFKKELDERKIRLDSLLQIIGNIEKYTQINSGLLKVLKDCLSYEDVGGFITRNDTAHERRLLEEFNSSDLMDKINKINTFNSAFLTVFYVSDMTPGIAKETINTHLINESNPS